MERKVWAFIQEHNLIQAGDLVVAGVSGGPDSVALLHILRRLAADHGFSLHVFHLNHCLRPEAELDQKLVEELCREYGVPLTVRREDIKALAEEMGYSLEEMGRIRRYRLMEDLCRQVGGTKIATAHQRDDQAETVLMHLIQGSGARGLQGILPQRGMIIRPLLTLSREEILEYLHSRDYLYRIDSSNYDQEYLRNRIRWELLPLLTGKYNPGMAEVLARTAEVFREENRYWDDEVARRADVMAAWDDGIMKVEAGPLNDLPLALRRRLVQHLITRAGGRRASWADVDRVVKLAQPGRSGQRVQVSGGVWVTRSYQTLEFSPTLNEEEMDFCYELPVPGSLQVPEMEVLVTSRLVERIPETRDPWRAYFDLDKLQQPLFVRSRRPGDRFRPQGLGGSKKVKDYLIDEKIPLRHRNRIGILASEDEIYWLMGLRQDERGMITPETGRILQVEASRWC